MRSVLAMALKDLTLIHRDWLGMFFIICFPVGMGAFFGFIMGSMGGGGGSGKMTIAIVDEDDTEISKKFVAAIEKNEKINMQRLPREEAIERTRRGQMLGLIVLTKGFGETAGLMWEKPPTIILGLDPSRQAEASMLQGFVMQAIGELVGARFMDAGSMRSVVSKGAAQMREDQGVPANIRILLEPMLTSLDSFLANLDELQKEQKKEGNEPITGSGFAGMQFANFESLDVTRQLDPNSPAALQKKLRSRWDISFPQASMWGVLACAACFATTVVREKVRGTLVRLQAAPVSNAHIVAGKAVACFAAVVFVLVLMGSLGVAMGMRPRNWPLLIVAVLCVAYCFVGIMMFLSTVGRTEEAVAGASWGANMVMAMFGGGMIPLAFLPGSMQTLSNLSPVKWGILALEGAIWRGFSVTEMILPISVLLIVGSIGMAIGTVVIRRRMEQV